MRSVRACVCVCESHGREKCRQIVVWRGAVPDSRLQRELREQNPEPAATATVHTSSSGSSSSSITAGVDMFLHRCSQMDCLMLQP